jgi:hypothetical protein
MNRFQRRILVLFVAVTAAMICFPTRRASDQLLARSKLLTSILIALCFPVFPVAIAVPYVLLEGGHLWEAALLFETAIFVGLFILSYFVLSVTQLLSRRGPLIKRDDESSLKIRFLISDPA